MRAAVRHAAVLASLAALAACGSGGNTPWGVAGRFFSGDDPRANSAIAPRVDGNFTGTTDEILLWAACKWGIGANAVRAQAVGESWWHQTALSDWNSDPSYCAPGHCLGVDDPANHPGQCPNSWGILQNKWFFEKAAWPGIRNSTAFNADTTYAI